MTLETLEMGLRFDEAAHVYTYAGRAVPSVTQILNPLSARVYGEVPADVLARAADRGTQVHKAIELYVQTGFKDIEAEYAGYLEGFERWWKQYSPKAILTEQKFVHPILGYAGTVDLVCNIGNRLVIVDYKTTSELNEMLVGIQLEAYKRGVSRVADIGGTAALHLRKDGGFSYLEMPEDKAQERWNVFLSLLTIENYARRFAA